MSFREFITKCNYMRYFLSLITLLLCVIIYASNTTNQQVTLNVDSFDSITVPGTAVTLTVSAATAGSDPDPVTQASSLTYLSTTTNAKKIVGSINTVPTDTTLDLTVNPIDGTQGTSAGSITLSSTDQDLLTAIPQYTMGDATTSYTFNATAAAGVISSTNATVTLTIQAN